MKIASTKIYLDKRYLKKDSTYPVKLKITYQRMRKFYSLNQDLNEKDFNKLFTAHKLSKEMLILKNEMLQEENKAKYIIDQVKYFTFEKFEDKYLSGTPNSNSDFISLFEQKVNSLKRLDRFGTADSYGTALKSLLKFRSDIKFEAIDLFFLKEYEKWMVDKGASKTTVGIYLRALRVIVNEAVEKKIIPLDQYPFGKRRYQIPKGRNIKKALSLSDIKKIYDYQPKNDKEAKAKDFWFFMYLANGMNMKDVAFLKYSNIEDDFLVFERKKTENTISENRKISVFISPEIRKIIQERGNKKINVSDLIFPIINTEDSSEKQRKVYKQFNKCVNDYLKAIAFEVGLEGKVSCMAARHSFSTQLKRSGRSTEFIQEALGHTSPLTTQHYLDSFENRDKIGITDSLLNFEKCIV